jgi:hypothetical protein
MTVTLRRVQADMHKSGSPSLETHMMQLAADLDHAPSPSSNSTLRRMTG